MARFPTTSAVIRWHDYLIGAFGGSYGVRDMHLLESAVAAPRFMRDYGSRDAVAQAAALGYSVANNHAFIDGNKRTALLTLMVFLRRNGYRIHFGMEWADIMEGVASGSVSRPALAELLRQAL